MFTIVLVNVAVFSGISGFLAVLLVIADYYLANYGDCKININDGKKELQVKGGNSLLNSLAENNIFVSSACGGKGTCGLCKVQVHNGAGPLLPTEKPYLNDKERSEGVRLSCQIKVKEDIFININPTVFSVKKYNTKVSEIVDYTYDIKGVFFKLLEPPKIEFKAGQYVQLESKKYPKAKQPVIRAYSMASPPASEDAVELIVRLVPDGIMTTYVHQYLQVNDNVSFTGPFGDFYIREGDADMIFVAGGSGMAPFKSILEDLRQQGCKRRIVYLFGARSEKDLFLTEEMNQFQKTLENFTYIPVLSQAGDESDWKGKKGYIPPLLKEYIRDAAKTEGYLCGSPGLLAVTETEMKKLGMKEIYYDSFG